MIGIIKDYYREARQGGSGIGKNITIKPPDDFIASNVNDEELVIDNTYNIWERLLLGVPSAALAFLFTMVLPVLFDYRTGNFFVNLFAGLFFVGFAVTAWGFTVYYIINPRRKFIFNRLNGTITLPAYKRRWWSRKTVTQPFKKTRTTCDSVGFRGPIDAYRVGILGTTHTLAIFYIHPFNRRTAGAFSALVWYMDKNRPLPPGKVLDPYREKDYNRRKAEGFPPPLFFASIDTPEWEGADEERKQALALQGVAKSKRWKSEGLKKKRKKGRR